MSSLTNSQWTLLSMRNHLLLPFSQLVGRREKIMNLQFERWVQIFVGEPVPPTPSGGWGKWDQGFRGITREKFSKIHNKIMCIFQQWVQKVVRPILCQSQNCKIGGICSQVPVVAAAMAELIFCCSSFMMYKCGLMLAATVILYLFCSCSMA